MIGKTAGEIFDYCCLHYADRTSMVYEEERYTFADLKEKGTRLANSFYQLGLVKGDRVAMLFANCPEVLISLYGIAQTGMVYVPLAYYLKIDDIIHILREAEVSAIMYHEYFGSYMDRIREELPDLKVFICKGKDEKNYQNGELCLNRLIDEGSNNPIENKPGEDDLFTISYTGGTTGKPKGVIHSHRTFVASVVMELMEWDIGHNEVYLALTPLTHASGMVTPAVWLRGGSVVILPMFDVEWVLKTIEKERVNVCFFVPTIIYALLDFPELEKYDTSSLTNILYGGAPIMPARLREAIDVFGPVFTQVYGQVEAPMVQINMTRYEHVEGVNETGTERFESCGKPSMFNTLKIIDDHGNELPAGEAGHIVVKTPNMMLGYLKRPEETAKTIRDGWLYTGDIGRKDRLGYVYIVDREKDMIVSGGFNIYPKEVEDTILEHPSIAAAAVIGVPDNKWGEAVKAIVILRPGQSVTEDELIAFCKSRKGSMFSPKTVDIVESMPLTPLGKADKKAMRAPFWENHGRTVG